MNSEELHRFMSRHVEIQLRRLPKSGSSFSGTCLRTQLRIPNLRHRLTALVGLKPSNVILTANTAKLQEFILKHLNTGDAWKDSFELRRAP